MAIANPGGASRRLGGRRGVAALEFGLLAPVLMMVLAGIVDIGNATVAKIALNGVVNSSASYALVRYDQVNSTSGATLASDLGKIAANGRKTAWADAVITVNNGPKSTVTNGVAAPSGTAASADSCYCPTGAATGTVTWGTATTCGNACPSGGGKAGKFVLISASHTYTPIFSGYSFVPNGKLTVAALVQVQ